MHWFCSLSIVERYRSLPPTACLTAVPGVSEALAADTGRKHSLPPAPEGPAKRSKKGKKSKGGSKAVIPELNPSDYVRVVKVTNRDDLLHEGPVLVSKSDKAGQMQLSDNRMSVTSSKGYRMVRFLLACKHACCLSCHVSCCCTNCGNSEMLTAA